MIKIANNLLAKFGLPPNITNLKQCDHKYFVKVYEAMLNEKLPGLILHAVEKESQIHNIQVVIDSLATDILDVDLSHIITQDVVNGDEIQIQNLLEIFDGLLDFVMEEIEDDKLNDSNVLPDDHEVLSDVFQEEFGASYSRKNKLASDTKVDCLPEKPLSPSKGNKKQPAFHNEMLVNKEHGTGINLSQVSKWLSRDGDSTNDLINEAELIERRGNNRKEVERRKEKTIEGAGTASKGVGDEGSVNHWSSILAQTSSALESFADINEIGKRPRRKLEVEKKKENQQRNGNNIQRHKHTHHHFYHHEQGQITSSTSASSSPSSKTSTLSKDQQKTTNLTEPSTSKNERVAFTTAEIQTDRPSKVDSCVQTESSSRLKPGKSYKDSLPSHKDFLNSISHTGTKPPEGRSQQFLDLTERLQTLQSQINEGPTGILHTSSGENVAMTTVNTEEDSNKILKKEKSKVSFARDVLLSRDDRPSYSSDTEIDYSTLSQTIATHPTSLYSSTRADSGVSSTSSSSSDEYQEATSLTTRFQKPFVKRDERLHHLQNKYRSVNKENRKQLRKIRHDYSEQRHILVERKNDAEKQSNLNMKSVKRKKKQLPKLTSTRIVDRTPEKEYALKLAGIYGKKERGRNKEIKCRKRSASASPVRRRQLKSRMVLNEDEILPVMEEEFPFIHLSPHTAKLMWQRQMRQVDTLCKAARTCKPSKTQQKILDAQNRQEALMRIMKKELKHNQRLKEHKEQKENKSLVRKKLAERRQRSARARRYYDDYVVSNKAQMLKKRYKEEAIFKNLFEEGLEIQKERLREMKNFAKEQKEKNDQKEKNEIESMENYYRGQFAMLAESIAQERNDLQVRQKAQKQVLKKMRNEMRKRMEDDIKIIQQQLTADGDSHTFRQIDADNLRREFQLATYKASRFI